MTGLQDQERELMDQNRQAEARVMSAHDLKDVRQQIMRQLEEINGVENGLLKQAKEDAASNTTARGIGSPARPVPRS